MKYILLILCFFLLPTFAFAKTVTVTGYGGSVQTAEKDALRNAVESAVGVYVDSKTLTENYALVKDRVFTSSEGFIASFEKLSEKYENGIYIVKVRADVREEFFGNVVTDKQKRHMIKTQLLDPSVAVIVKGDGSGVVENSLVAGLKNIGFTRIVNFNAKPEYLIEATVTLNKTGLTGGIYNIKLNVTNKATGDVVFSGEDSARGAGSMGKTRALKRICEKLLGQIDLTVMKSAASMKTHIKIVMANHQSLSITEKTDLLNNVSGVLKVYPRRSKNNITEFDVDYFGNIEDFVKALEQKGINITEIGRDFIKI
ncbi:MAG: hypothetical protein IKN43_08195 [Selenomonadaceae bacterium]|nr:hypothetical protein [Selenomonadaceae bacterium]